MADCAVDEWGRLEKGKDKKAERPLGGYYFIFIFSPRQEGAEGMTAVLKWWATRCPSQPPKMNSPNNSDQPVLMKRLVQCRIMMVFHRLSSSWPALVLFLPLRMIHLLTGTITGTHKKRAPHLDRELKLKYAWKFQLCIFIFFFLHQAFCESIFREPYIWCTFTLTTQCALLSTLYALLWLIWHIFKWYCLKFHNFHSILIVPLSKWCFNTSLQPLTGTESHPGCPTEISRSTAFLKCAFVFLVYVYICIQVAHFTWILPDFLCHNLSCLS